MPPTPPTEEERIVSETITEAPMEPTCLATEGLMIEGLMVEDQTEGLIEALTETNSREPSHNNKHQLKR